MTDRWHQIEELYHAALRLDANQRAPFLESACKGDEEVRREVESLLASDQQAESFLESPVLEVAAEAMAAQGPPSLVGHLLGPFQILSALGAGGMGEVYKAKDTRLNRTVAIKILPRHLSERADLRQRFEREARALASLSHPHICPIHDIGKEDGIDFLVMEYLEGETLASRLTKGTLPLEQALRHAVEIAQALDEAHRHGVIHRDLKPGNVMLTKTGAKLLDFGLAKQQVLSSVANPPSSLSPLARGTTGGQTATENESLTEEGLILGTLEYMAPEQVEGKRTDARTDIFAFGVVLYEMVTGKKPFDGESKAGLAAAILKSQPSPLATIQPMSPPALERLVERCLEKDPEKRWQGAQDLAGELKWIVEDLANPGISRTPKTQRRISTKTPPARRTTRLIGMAAVLVLAIVGALWFYFARLPRTLVPMSVVRFTSYPGKEKDPALSPDGKQMAFVWDGEGRDNFDIYLRSIASVEELPLATERPFRLTTDRAADLSPTWSPDGRYIAFARVSEGNSAVYLVPSLGGHERKLTGLYSIRSEGRTLDWSPDGKSLVTAAKGSPEDRAGLFSISVDTGNKQRLTWPPTQFGGDTSPAFSPDGQTLAFTRVVAYTDIYLLPLASKQPKRLTSDNTSCCSVWTPDGRELIFASTTRDIHTFLRMSVSGGKSESVGLATKGINPSISHRGTRLAYVEQIYDTDIWLIPVPDPRGRRSLPTKLISSSQWDDDPQFSPDGKRIAFGSNRSGHYESWVCDSDGRNPKQLTSIPEASITGSARWSPDGRAIAFGSFTKDLSRVFVVSSDGGSPRTLIEENGGGFVPSWSRDGHSIYFCSDRKGSLQIWKVPSEGGKEVQVTMNGGLESFEAADGKTLYYSKLNRADPNSGSARIWKVPVDGGKETLVFSKTIYPRYWTVTDQGIYFVPSDWAGSPAIEFFSFATGKVTQVVPLEKPPVRGFHPGLAVSPDGRWILCALLEQDTSDIMLVENFR